MQKLACFLDARKNWLFFLVRTHPRIHPNLWQIWTYAYHAGFLKWFGRSDFFWYFPKFLSWSFPFKWYASRLIWASTFLRRTFNLLKKSGKNDQKIVKFFHFFPIKKYFFWINLGFFWSNFFIFFLLKIANNEFKKWQKNSQNFPLFSY